MGRPTLNVGTLHAGLNINSVPDSATIGVDIRTIPGQDHAQLRQRLERALGSDVRLAPMVDVEAIYSNPEEPWMKQVFAAHERQTGERPSARTATYFTDAAVLNEVYRNIPICVLGPGEPHLAHQTDEWCSLTRLEQSTDLFRTLMKNWCGV